MCRYVIYLTFYTNDQLSTRPYDKGANFSLVNFYFPIVSSGGLVDIDIYISLYNDISHRIVECQKDHWLRILLVCKLQHRKIEGIRYLQSNESCQVVEYA